MIYILGRKFILLSPTLNHCGTYFFCNLSYLLIVSCRNLSISGKGETIRMYRAFNLSLLSGYRLRENEIDLDVYETLQVYACCFFKDKFLLKIDIKFNHSISK